MFGYGEFPIGGYPLEDSLSVEDPLPGLIEDPLLEREFLLRSKLIGETTLGLSTGIPILTDSGSVLLTDTGEGLLSDGIEVSSVTIADIFDVSSSGYISDELDIPYKSFPSAIARPYNFSSELPLPDLSGGAALSAGEIKINNPDGLLDADAVKDWLGAELENYIGRKDDPLTNFAMFARGSAAGVTWDLETFSILHKDLRFKLQKRLQSTRYMGTGACLRFDGSVDWVTYGDILDQLAASSFTVEILFRTTSSGTIKTLASKLGSGAIAGWILKTDSSNRFVIYIGDGTNSVHFPIPDSSALPYFDGRLHRASFVVDRTAQVLRLYIDGDLLGTSTSTAAVGNLSNGSALLAGARGDASEVWIGDLDDFRFWSKARTQAEIQGDMHRELIGIEEGLEIYTKYNEGSGTTANDSTDNNRDGTIIGCTWVGSLEGDASLENIPKPIALGIKRQISPRLVDSQRLVYQWHDRMGESCDDVQDGGDSYTFGSEVTDIYASTPAPGTYNVLRSELGSYFRLGSNPVGVITCSVHGDATGGYVDDMSGIHRRVASVYGKLSTDYLNLNTYVELSMKAPAAVGFYFDTEIQIDTALDEISKRGGSGWWTPDRVARLSVGRIDDPATLESDIIVTEDDLVEPKKGGKYSRSPAGVRIGEVVLGYRRYNTTIGTEQAAGILDLGTKEDISKEYRFKRAIDPNRSADSDTLTIFTEIDDPVDAQAEADRLLGLWKVDRGIYRVTMDQGVLAYFIGSVFELRVDRYDTKTGKKFIVFGIAEDMGQYGQVDKLEPALFG